RVVLRPHYQTARLSPGVIARLAARFGADPGFRHVDRMEESDSLHDSDLLISDWSAMAIEYALGLGKPVLFVDVPPRVRNPEWAQLGLEPMEMRIRRELGRVLPLDGLGEAPRHVADLLADAEPFRKRSEAFREEWAFNFGASVGVGARRAARDDPAPAPAPLGLLVHRGPHRPAGRDRLPLPLALLPALPHGGLDLRAGGLRRPRGRARLPADPSADRAPRAAAAVGPAGGAARGGG